MAAHLFVFVGLLAVAYVFAQIARIAGLPPAAATTLVGIAAAGIFGSVVSIALTPATLALFLPALIFDGAWAIDGRALRRRATTIAILAIPGTAITTVVIASGAFVTGIPAFAALTLGALLAATDPVAVLALFRTLPVPEDLRTIVEGESIANDGVAAVLTTTLVAYAVAGASSPAPGVAAAVLEAVYAAVSGIAIGAALAIAAARVVRGARSAPFVIVATLTVAYASYALATVAHGSGIFASAAAGVVLRTAAFAKDERTRVATAWDAIANVANATVFLLVGLNLTFERIFNEPALILSTIAAVIVARLLLAYVLAPAGARPPLATAWRHTIALAGVRGGLSLALALGLPVDFPSRPQILDAVFAVVFATLIVQGWTLGPILRRLALRDRSRNPSTT